MSGGDTIFRLTRLSAQPGEALPFPDDAAFVFDYLKSGALSDWTTWARGPRSVPWTEPPQLIVAGDVPAEVLELAVIPSVETVAAAEPEASAPAAEESRPPRPRSS